MTDDRLSPSSPRTPSDGAPQSRTSGEGHTLAQPEGDAAEGRSRTIWPILAVLLALLIVVVVASDTVNRTAPAGSDQASDTDDGPAASETEDGDDPVTSEQSPSGEGDTSATTDAADGPAGDAVEGPAGDGAGDPDEPPLPEVFELTPHRGRLYGPGAFNIDNIGHTAIKDNTSYVRIPIGRSGTVTSMTVYFIWRITGTDGGYGGGTRGRYAFNLYRDVDGEVGTRLGGVAEGVVADLVAEHGETGVIRELPLTDPVEVVGGEYLWIEALNPDPNPRENWWSTDDAYFWSASGTRPSGDAPADPTAPMDTSEHGVSHPLPNWRWPRDSDGELRGAISYRARPGDPQPFWPNVVLGYDDGFQDGQMAHISFNLGGDDADGPVVVDATRRARQRLVDATPWAERFHQDYDTITATGVWILAVREADHADPLTVHLLDADEAVLATATVPGERFPVRQPGDSDSYAWPNGWRYVPFDDGASPDLRYDQLHHLQAETTSESGFWFPGGLGGFGTDTAPRYLGEFGESYLEIDPGDGWRQQRFYGVARNDAFFTLVLALDPHAARPVADER
jgi:hypothetical protein